MIKESHQKLLEHPSFKGQDNAGEAGGGQGSDRGSTLAMRKAIPGVQDSRFADLNVITPSAEVTATKESSEVQPANQNFWERNAGWLKKVATAGIGTGLLSSAGTGVWFTNNLFSAAPSGLAQINASAAGLILSLSLTIGSIMTANKTNYPQAG